MAPDWNWKRKRRLRLAGRILFLLYLAALVYFMFFADCYGHRIGGHEDYRANLRLFREIRRFWRSREHLGFRAVFLNLACNVAGFLPFGFFLPVVSERLTGFFSVTIQGALFSLLIESVQLVTRSGVFDVDDLVLNTAGAAFGWLLFFAADRIRRRMYGI